VRLHPHRSFCHVSLPLHCPRTVVRGNNQHDDVSHVRPPLAHLTEGSVARRVDEGYLFSGGGHNLVRPDVLRDATRLAADHLTGKQACL